MNNASTRLEIETHSGHAASGKYLISVIGPATKLHITMLVIKGEPSNVYLACALEDARRYVQAATVIPDHHISVVCPVEPLIRT